MTNVTGPLVVQDGSLLLTWHLDSLDIGLITARERHLVTVHDHIFVALQEIHLEALGVNHGRAQIDVGWVQTSIDCVVVTGANFELDALEVALRAPIQWLTRLHKLVTLH